MKDSIVLKETFCIEPSILYNAWLDSDLHSQMTGGEASCSKNIGDTYTAWDNYIFGKNVELLQDHKIVQTWRSTEFLNQDEDSVVTIEFTKIENDTLLTLTHDSIPKGQGERYEKGWVEHYFIPMKAFFEG